MKTNLDNLYKTNQNEESNGVWFDVSETTGFHLRRFGGSNADRVKKSLAKHHKPFARRIESGSLSASMENEIMAKVFFEACLIDWKGVEIDGKEVKCEVGVAIKFFTALPELLNELFAQCNSADTFRAELEALGNS